MLQADERYDLNQISVTGARAIAIMGLLATAPSSLDEIKNKLIKFGIIDKANSDDILRIDLNTLKSIGCELSRPKVSNNYKYELLNHPFKMNLKSNDIKLLKDVYRKIEANADINLVLEYDNLFKKLADCVYEEADRQALLGITSLKRYDVEKIKRLLDCSDKNKVLNLVYKKPTAQSSYQKKVIAEKVVFNNSKVYLYCYDLGKCIHEILSVKGIKEILSENDIDTKIELKQIVVRFRLKSKSTAILTEDEKIMETTEDFLIVEGKYFNEFLATQRILSLGADCIVDSPSEFRLHIISKLKEMKKIYEKK